MFKALNYNPKCMNLSFTNGSKKKDGDFRFREIASTQFAAMDAFFHPRNGRAVEQL